MFVRVLVTCSILMTTVFSGAAFAEDLQITGTIDGFSMFSLNRPVNQTVPLRAFDNRHAQFSLNYAEVSIQQMADPIGFRVDVGLGEASKVVNERTCPQEDIQRNDIHGVLSHSHGIIRRPCEPSTQTDSTGKVIGGTSLFQYLQQAFIMAKVRENIQFDFGKFVTPMGAEVVETKDNWNYSRGLLFTYANPFYHFGLRANVTHNSHLSYAVYVVNGWNNTQDNNTPKTVIGSVTYKPYSRASITGNIAVGDENPNFDRTVDVPLTDLGPGQLSVAHLNPRSRLRRVGDIIVTFKPAEAVDLMTNFVYGSQEIDPQIGGAAAPGDHVDWKGIAVYTRVKVSEKLIVTPRYEWFADPDGFMTGTPQTVQESTLTVQVPYKKSSMVSVEWRRDWNRNGVDAPLDAPADILDPVLNVMVHNAKSHNFQHTFLIGWTYSFSNQK